MSKIITIEETIRNWRAKRSGHTPPFRFELGPIESYVQFILEPNDLGEFKIKRAGIYFERLFCGMLQGRNFTSLFSGQNISELKKDLTYAFETPAILHIQFMASDQQQEIVLLPVRSDHGPLEVALGVIDLQEMPKTGVTFARLLDSRVEKISPAHKERQYGFSAPKTSFQTKSTPFKVVHGAGEKTNSKKPNLTVVNSIKREP